MNRPSDIPFVAADNACSNVLHEEVDTLRGSLCSPITGLSLDLEDLSTSG